MSFQPKQLTDYIKAFSTLRRDYKYGGAPHKPILLLSVLHQIESGQISQNRIFITPELVGTFKDFWRQLVTTPHTSNFALPFYHMCSEKFWHLKIKSAHELVLTSSYSIKSFSSLHAVVDWAELDPELFGMLQLHENREQLRLTLLNAYFKGCSELQLAPTTSYLFQLEAEILYEAPEDYQAKCLELQKLLKKELLEEENFVRDGAFKKVIANLYDHTCAISGLRVRATQNISMIDGCHIKPWSLSHDDTATNGIALCPNLHRAFDRGLISLDEDYRLLLSPHFREAEVSPYGIAQFRGKQVLLPQNASWYPAQENLAYHRERVFLT
jgi:putative restriction endonuclease